MEKIIELAKKLYSMAQGGDEIERDNAKRILDNLMKKHSITIADLEATKKQLRYFPIANDYENLMLKYICKKVANDWHIDFYQNKDKRKAKALICELSDYEFLQVNLMFDFYLPILKEQLDIFVDGFILSQDLFPEKENSETSSQITDKKRINAIVKVSKVINKETYIKSLPTSK